MSLSTAACLQAHWSTSAPGSGLALNLRRLNSKAFLTSGATRGVLLPGVVAASKGDELISPGPGFPRAGDAKRNPVEVAANVDIKGEVQSSRLVAVNDVDCLTCRCLDTGEVEPLVATKGAAF
mmetsp:Transcript_37537/g.60529  ORF Transcript_37537/g.60529 Transcript_37537/m.60529 type:complete len:123 (-) Transcript_37537:150-518(-)